MDLKFKILGSLIVTICLSSEAQNHDVSLLFQNKEPLTTRLSFSIKEVKSIVSDTIYTPSILCYKDEYGNWDTLKINLRARGNFRRDKCFFPPLRIRTKKKDCDGTLFSGNKNLKLVLPCYPAGSYSDLILKEYLCYQLYEVITPYIFKTQLVDVSLTDIGSRKSTMYSLKGFFIEDDDLIAKRFNGKIVDDLKIHPLQLHDTISAIHCFFEYMIGNTDWSTHEQHNIKILKLDNKKYVPLAYDFDMAGLVNAPYATVSEVLEIKSVRERVYRGFCRSGPLFEYVRLEYLRLEPKILEVTKQFENDFSAKDLAGIRAYLESFFDILKNEKSFEKNIVLGCRAK